MYDYVTKGDFIMEGGEITSCEATIGAAVCVTGGNASISGGSINNNTAETNGGGVYVDKGKFTMNGGSMTENTAVNGGAAYVTGGNFEMSNGSINSNTASMNGGAVYMADGNFTMHHGTVNSNTATNGGAVYMAGVSAVFKMESGEMSGNHAVQNSAFPGSGDGGAIYAVGGTLYIGLESCVGSIAEESGDDLIIKEEREKAHQRCD